jgi:hypothetical protein
MVEKNRLIIMYVIERPDFRFGTSTRTTPHDQSRLRAVSFCMCNKRLVISMTSVDVNVIKAAVQHHDFESTDVPHLRWKHIDQDVYEHQKS